MRMLTTALIAAALIAPWAAALAQTNSDTKPGSQTTTLRPGEYGYIPANGSSSTRVYRNAKDLPPEAVQSQKTVKDLRKKKLPTNEPVDVAKAAAEARAKAKAKAAN